MKYKLPPLPTLILLLVVFAGIFVDHCRHPEKKFKFTHFTTGIGKKSTNTSNQWHCSFTYLDGSVQGWVTARSDQSRLILSSNLEEGKVVYQLYDHAGSLHYSFPVGQPTDTLAGAFESGERYEIRSTATQAKGSFDFRME